MNTFENFSPNAKVWIYQADRAFNDVEIENLQHKLSIFCQQWTAHNQQLKAGFDIKYNQIIILSVDETMSAASGCSIDKSVAFVRNLQERYEIDLLDRMTFVYRDMLGDIHTASRQNFARLYDMGVIDDETTVFDTVVPTLGDFRSSFELPLQKSWHRRMVTMSV